MYDDEWRIEEDGVDMVLKGPGDLQIALRHYEASSAVYTEYLYTALPTSTGESIQQRSWIYPLQEGINLQLISTCMTNPEAKALHTLHVGHTVSWHLPEQVAETLHMFFRQAQ